MLPRIDMDILAELSRGREVLARLDGAVDQAGKAVEAARAAHRRAVEERDAQRRTVERLGAELRDGGGARYPLLEPAEPRAAGRNGAAAAGPPRDREADRRLEAATDWGGPDPFPPGAHVDRVNRLAASGALELPPEPDDDARAIDELARDLEPIVAEALAAPRPDPPAAPVPHARDDASAAMEVLETVRVGDGRHSRYVERPAAGRKSDGEPLPDGAPAPVGYRAVSRAEYRKTPPAYRHERYRAVREGASGSSCSTPPAAPERRYIDPPGGAWDPEAATSAIELLEGRGAKGTKTIVCRRSGCRKARAKHVGPCACGEVAWDAIMDVVNGKDLASLLAKQRGPAQAIPAREELAAARSAIAGHADRIAEAATADPERPLHVPAPAGGWDGTALYAAAARILGPDPTVTALRKLAVCRRCQGLNAWTEDDGFGCACSPDVRGGDMVLYSSYAAGLDAAREQRPDGGAADVTTAAVDRMLSRALSWHGVGSRLSFAEEPPSAAEILTQLGEAWVNVLPSKCTGYLVRGRPPAFWLGNVTARTPATLEGDALVAAVRRVLGIPSAASPPRYFAPGPIVAWSDDLIRQAAAALGDPPATLNICDDCGVARGRTAGKCKCGSTSARHPRRVDGEWRAPAGRPTDRASGAARRARSEEAARATD